LVETFQALAVFVIALLPGALYVWAFEREAGGWGLGATDRLLRFVGFSALFHTLIAPITYIFYRDFVVTGRLIHAKSLPLWLWLEVLLYVAVPTLAGTITGSATAAGKQWTRFLAGRSPAPRAWDHLFSAHDLDGYVRLRLTSGQWIVGAFAKSANGRLRSYAAGYPDTQDLYLAETFECDPETGDFLADDQQNLIPRGIGVLVRWDGVQYLEFIDARPPREAEASQPQTEGDAEGERENREDA
jgi:hypothetical protein